MPPQATASLLVKKFGAKLDKAVTAHANDETTYGLIRLPGGIVNGIAQLDECKIGTYKDGDYKGELFLRLAGIVNFPKTVNTKDGDIPVDGLQTSVMFPLCDTKSKAKGETTTFEENIAKVLNEFRKLGADTKGATGRDVEGIAAALQEQKPFFRFSTTETPAQGTYAARIWENWHGNKGLEDYVPDDAAAAGANDKSGKVDPDPVKGDEPVDVEALIVGASDGDEEATKNLKAHGDTLGITGEQIDKANDWDEVRTMFKEADDAASAANGDPSPAPVADAPPKKGDVFHYTVLDAQGKPVKDKSKKEKPPIEVAVLTVNVKAKTCKVKNLEDGTTEYADVKWGDLKGN